jgi:hypothetical protein
MTEASGDKPIITTNTATKRLRAGFNAARPEPLAFWEMMAIFAFVTGLVLSAIYAFAVGDAFRTFAIVFLVGCAAWLSGSLLGFLFGVPRFQADPQGDAQRILPNTNLEQISDWLTKIIVGATLVQLGPLVTRLSLLFQAVGGEVDKPGAVVATGSAMIFFFTTGFMWGYLWCSLRVFREMAALTRQDMDSLKASRQAVAGLNPTGGAQ